MKEIREKGAEYFFLLCSLVSIGAVLLICYFIFSGAYPALRDIGVWAFLTGDLWKPTDVPPSFGIFNMIAGSVYVTAGACIFGVPVGVFAAVYMAKYCPRSIYPVASQLVSLLAGIPSIIYGFFGMMLIVPFIQEYFAGNGNSVLAASIVLGVMILPTVIKVSEVSIRAVPKSYFEGALALGATKEQSIFFVGIPAAKSGILAGVILGIGRAIGETMAVVMVAGNSNILPDSIFKSVRTLTANIVLEMGYAAGSHYDAIVATGAVLFVFILILNIILNIINRGAQTSGGLS
ncbi:MAG: phosphate ABC transporter permease subunit PstC [Chitinispirillia bacterium]|nr:phosphate ABC transporter permease subunit PstC [Chitinispirillia bacterium]MCL2268857.1 phosphate ABC transporter permease subunit PstC [Chitinispirillia bacterium]